MGAWKRIRHYAKKVGQAIAGAGESVEEAGQRMGDAFSPDTWTGAAQAEKEAARAKANAELETIALAKEEAGATAETYSDLERERRKRAAMRGRSSTILAGALGESGLTTTRKTLLGG